MLGQFSPTRTAEHTSLLHLPVTRIVSLLKAGMADTIRIRLRAPVLTLVLAATAIPVELRPLGSESIDFGVGLWDVLANIGGYVPVGIVLGKFGFARAIISAGLISIFAESLQLVMVHRTPSAIDVLTNLLGATLGAFISIRWRMRSPALGIGRSGAVAALAVAFVIYVWIWTDAATAPNARGVTAPGTLEAEWRFDESAGNQAVDSSGHGLNGRLKHRARRVAGVRGSAILLDGKRDAISFGRATALRLAGNMTICAWINSTAFPADDAAIVSSLQSSGSRERASTIPRLATVGYQLDTTIDRGPRTIGFKLSDSCGELMARYGATPLALNTWYHVAGVYDAEAKSLNVYLNGELDDGFLLGAVSGTQRSSRKPVYVGRRSSDSGFEFSGLIDDVRIYSLALTKPEIVAAMNGAEIDNSTAQRVSSVQSHQAAGAVLGAGNRCAVLSDPEDSRLPTFAGSLGVLAAVAWAGLWSSTRKLPCLVVSLVAGLGVLATTTPNLPSFNLWLIPLTSLAGGVSVAVSLYRPGTEA
ncbi:MAG TPA: LamG-like jellyroll fold domain-containing protein [Verrucomicrobiae bacterium]|nr:LamG-like jellyroll fold domain-containing protein [Verrucomicrobiae bacterium]